MQLLTWLTIIYLVVLVLALAVSLITICVYLWKIGNALAQVKQALLNAETNTSPLQGQVETINSGLTAVRDGLKAADENLAATGDALNTVAAQLGVGAKV